jgi:hypothetical protein
VWVLRDFEEAQRLDEQIKKASGINWQSKIVNW